MSNKILKALTAERIERLKLSFSSSRKVFWDEDKNQLIHAGEYGVYRERAVQELVKLYMPQQFGIGTGFIITNQGAVSTQCDIVIYDLSKTPGIITESHQAFYSVETVVAVCEVKSDVKSASDLNSYLIKLAKIKSLREQITNPYPYRSHKGKPFNPADNTFDHMFTFLVCNKLCFDPTSVNLSLSESIEPRFRHNFIVSINDGAYCYSTNSGLPVFPYPTTGRNIHENHWIKATDEDMPVHFKCFLTCFYNAMNVITLLESDMTLYLEDKPC